MTTPSLTQKLGRIAVGIVAVLLVIGIGWALLQYRSSLKDRAEQQRPVATNSRSGDQATLELLELSEKTLKAMHLKTVPAVVPRFSRRLHLRGSLAIDPNRLSHVHARFPGTIVEIATTKGLLSEQTRRVDPSARTLQQFDKVERGAPLAVIWSKDLGEKKSQYAAALAALRTEKQKLQNALRLEEKGSISVGEIRAQQLVVDQAVISAFTAVETLRSYQVSKEDIKQVEQSADKIHLSQETDKSYATDWPRVVVTAPISGAIVDKVVTNDEIVDANADLFKIADFSVLAVYLHAYEEDLPALEQLPKPLQVSIKILASPELGEIPAEIDRFSQMIDPNEHMALLIGTVKNPGNELLAMQAITAEVGIPAEKGVVVIPANSVIDMRNEAIVYVQTDVSKPLFHRRRVSVVQRYFDVVYVRSELTEAQQQQGLQAIVVGDEVVSGGVLELEDYLQQQQ